MTDSNLLLTVAVLGGTGKEGKGLGLSLGARRLSSDHRLTHR